RPAARDAARGATVAAPAPGTGCRGVRDRGPWCEGHGSRPGDRTPRGVERVRGASDGSPASRTERRGVRNGAVGGVRNAPGRRRRGGGGGGGPVGGAGPPVGIGGAPVGRARPPVGI